MVSPLLLKSAFGKPNMRRLCGPIELPAGNRYGVLPPSASSIAQPLRSTVVSASFASSTHSWALDAFGFGWNSLKRTLVERVLFSVPGGNAVASFGVRVGEGVRVDVGTRVGAGVRVDVGTRVGAAVRVDVGTR